MGTVLFQYHNALFGTVLFEYYNAVIGFVLYQYCSALIGIVLFQHYSALIGIVLFQYYNAYITIVLFQCSRPCGQGRSKRKVKCVDRFGQQQPRRFCSGADRPPTTKWCYKQPCEC